MVFSRSSLRICRSWKEPVDERSAGIWASFSQPPFMCRKKLSPGLTDLSSEVRSTPHLPSLGVAELDVDCAKTGVAARSAPQTKVSRRGMGFLRKMPQLKG